MKKQVFPVLLAVTGMFLAFTAGMFLGRNNARGEILVSGLSPVPVHAAQPPETVPADTRQPETVVSFPLDINRASQEELTALPGIGEVLSQRIVDYRTEHGHFSVPEDLLNVSGIGTGKLEPILDLITTGG